MRELTLEELKIIEFDILKMFDLFCKENNIKYFLAYGTLLGAVRYKKFIPWDDDVDVLVPREDYDRLVEIFRDDEKYHLFAFEKDERYTFPFAKLCDMTTKKIETFYPNIGVDLGVEMDIFPLDSFDNDFEKAKKEAEYIHKKMGWLGFTKVEKNKKSRNLRSFFWRRIIDTAKLFGGKYYTKKIINKCNNPKQRGSRYIGAKAWCIYGSRGIIPAEAFSDTIEIEFEGQMFPAPIGYDEYLTCLYGDYLPEPPKEKQKSHHHFIAYRR